MIFVTQSTYFKKRTAIVRSFNLFTVILHFGVMKCCILVLYICNAWFCWNHLFTFLFSIIKLYNILSDLIICMLKFAWMLMLPIRTLHCFSSIFPVKFNHNNYTACINRIQVNIIYFESIRYPLDIIVHNQFIYLFNHFVSIHVILFKNNVGQYIVLLLAFTNAYWVNYTSNL